MRLREFTVVISLLVSGQHLFAPQSAPSPCASNAHVQATLGVGSVNFRTVNVFGGALFNKSYCVLRVLSDTWVLRCRMFILCVKEADWGMMAFVACFAPWLSE